jgi:hypothetical protein
LRQLDAEPFVRSALHSAAVLWIALAAHSLRAQQQPAPAETPQQELHRLTQAVAQAQAQVDASQRQLLELKASLTALERRLGSDTSAQPATPAPDDDLRERQTMQENQIATLDQTKVETESKYPVKITGLLLLNSFVNASQVDIAAAPTSAVAGAGSTGATLRQTILGLDARGPTLAGAASHADLRVDFFGSAASTTTASYADLGGLLRLRTAHATLDWKHTQAFVEMDRPIVSPGTPTSLVAIAEPALAWSGNLWSWAPQVGVTHTLDLGNSTRLALSGALMDVPDPPNAPGSTTATVSQAEHSRWPATEGHIALVGKQDDTGPTLGFGGYFSPHKTGGGTGYNGWAATLDFRAPLPMGFEASGSFYRGAALGGLGGGAYKDYIYNGSVVALDDVGGWAQLKKHATPRLELNGAFGLDNAYAGEVRSSLSTSTVTYQNLARNRSFFGNVIYSPRAYLLFSLEVRHITTTPVTGTGADSNVIGLAAGYKF